jgi:hypothetical protein
MKLELLNLANYLDSKGLIKAADRVDRVLRKVGQVQDLGPDTDRAIESRISDLASAWVNRDKDMLSEFGIDIDNWYSIRRALNTLLDYHSNPPSLFEDGWSVGNDESGDLVLYGPEGISSDDSDDITDYVSIYIMRKIEQRMEQEVKDQEVSPMDPVDPETILQQRRDLEDRMEAPDPMSAMQDETGWSFEFPEGAHGLHADVQRGSGRDRERR